MYYKSGCQIVFGPVLCIFHTDSHAKAASCPMEVIAGHETDNILPSK